MAKSNCTCVRSSCRYAFITKLDTPPESSAPNTCRTRIGSVIRQLLRQRPQRPHKIVRLRASVSFFKCLRGGKIALRHGRHPLRRAGVQQAHDPAHVLLSKNAGVTQQLRHGADLGGETRQTAAHRLNERTGHCLDRARLDIQIQPVEPREDRIVRQTARKDDLLGHTQPLCQLPERSRISAAGKTIFHVRPTGRLQPRQRLDHIPLPP